MAVNPYVSWTRRENQNEKALVDNIIIEAIKMYGMDVYYIPRKAVQLDKVWGEDPMNNFTEYHTVEMYFDNPLGNEGQGFFVGKFGYQVAAQTNFVVSKRRFTEVCTMQRPKEGDLIYSPVTKDWWEIKFVSHETPFLQLAQVTTWRLTVDKFVYSSERIDTGNNELDSLESVFSHDLVIPDVDTVADNVGIQIEANNDIDFGETENPFQFPELD